MMRRLWMRLVMRIGRRCWIRHVNNVLSSARETGVIDNWQMHELDGRLKYHPYSTSYEHRHAFADSARRK